MVVTKFVLPENMTPRRKHHEEMVKRLISSPRSRCAANTYIYRCDTDERQHIVGILNNWDKQHYSTNPTGQVINKEAVPDIKEWCSNSGGKDLIVVKKFLQHLTHEQARNNEIDTNGDSTHRSGSGTQRSDSGSRRGTPAYSRGNSFQFSHRPGMMRRETLTNGSFYPDPFEGRGNSSGMFNIVRGPPQQEYKKRPVTSDTVNMRRNKKPEPVERQNTQPVMKKPEYFEVPVNRSGVFGEVIRPPPQQIPQQQNTPVNNEPPSNSARPPSNARPASNRPSIREQWNRSGTMAPGRSFSKIPVKESNRPYTQGSSRSTRPNTQQRMLQKRQSTENQKFKYSANYHDERTDSHSEHNEPQNTAITPRIQSAAVSQRDYRIDIPQKVSPSYEHEVDFIQDNAGDSSHRPIAISGRAPARRWQPSQVF